MSWIDYALLALALFAAIRGWQTGFLGQLGGLVGRLIGVFIGIHYGPQWATHLTHTSWRGAIVVGIVIGCLSTGGALGRFAGSWVGRHLPFALFRTIDRALGVGVALTGLAVVVWLAAGIAANITWFGISQRVNQSVVLSTMQRFAPAPPALLGRVEALVSGVHIPNVVALLGSGQLPSVPTLLTSTAVPVPHGLVTVAATGGCAVAQTSTGVVVGQGEVLTSAHAVAGFIHVTVNGSDASVVYFDPRLDLAVLRTSSLGTLPVALALTPSPHAAVVIATTHHAHTGVDVGTVSVPSRGIYSGSIAPRSIELIGVSATTNAGVVWRDGQVVALVLAPSPISANVALAAPLPSLRYALAHAGRTEVSTQRCVS